LANAKPLDFCIEEPKLRPRNVRKTASKTTVDQMGGLARQAADYVQGSRRAIPSHDERDEERNARAHAERKHLYDWAEDNDRLIEADLETDKGGGEHAVLFRPEKLLVLKDTHPDVGFGGGFALNNKNAATVGEYLDRITLANQEFGSAITLVGIRRTGVGPSIRTQMPFFKGDPAMQGEIDSAMENAGYEIIGEAAYFNPGKNIVVYDLFPKNAVILDGHLHPIDPIIQRVNPEFVPELKNLYFAIAQGLP
jgi:hypothetical protein